MELDELRALIAVADSGSVHAAANRLGLPRTTVRRRLETLGAKVGSPLVLGGAQGAVLTVVGRSIVEGARNIIQDASHLLASARLSGGVVEGVLRVAMPVGLPPHALLPIFELCRERYPLLILDVEFHEDPTTAEEADVRFHFGDRLAKGPWITRTLMVVQEKLLASPRYLDARGVPKSLADLAQHDLLMWRRPTFAPDRLPTRDGGVFNVVPVLRTADIHHIRQLALRGAGIAFVPDAGLIDPEADPHGLVQVLPDLVQRPCGLHVLVPELLGRSPQVRALQESILAFLA